MRRLLCLLLGHRWAYLIDHRRKRIHPMCCRRCWLAFNVKPGPRRYLKHTKVNFKMKKIRLINNFASIIVHLFLAVVFSIVAYFFFDGQIHWPTIIFVMSSVYFGMTVRLISERRRKLRWLDGRLTKEEAAKEYMAIGRRLHWLDVAACQHISGCDNKQVFEIAYFLKNVSKRIENEYPESDYPRLLK